MSFLPSPTAWVDFKLPVLPSAYPQGRSYSLQDLVNKILKMGIENLFPLSAARLIRICSHVLIFEMPCPLNALTGEVQRLGFFYRQQLRHECQLVLPTPLYSTDFLLLGQRFAFYQMNQSQFQCQSIGLALAVILKCYEDLEALKRKKHGQWKSTNPK